MDYLESTAAFVTVFLITVCDNWYTQIMNSHMNKVCEIRQIYENIIWPLYTSSDLIAMC